MFPNFDERLDSTVDVFVGMGRSRNQTAQDDAFWNDRVSHGRDENAFSARMVRTIFIAKYGSSDGKYTE